MRSCPFPAPEPPATSCSSHPSGGPPLRRCRRHLAAASGEPFPLTAARSPNGSTAQPSTSSRAWHVRRSNRRPLCFRAVDRALGTYLGVHPEPLVLVGTPRNLTQFIGLSRSVGRLAGRCAVATPAPHCLSSPPAFGPSSTPTCTAARTKRGHCSTGVSKPADPSPECRRSGWPSGPSGQNADHRTQPDLPGTASRWPLPWSLPPTSSIPTSATTPSMRCRCGPGKRRARRPHKALGRATLDRSLGGRACRSSPPPCAKRSGPSSPSRREY